MTKNDFSLEEKNRLFDGIYSLYFDKNFGSTSKSDLETFLFSELLEHCINSGLAYDDYSLSKQLGITQSRIRALKERKELKYPYTSISWEKEFVNSAANAKYDPIDHLVKFIIEDVSVLKETRHYIEEKGWYDECSLNAKLLRIPLGCFIDICIKDESISILFSEEVKKEVRKIARSDSSLKEFINDFTREGLESFLMAASKEAIIDVLSVLPFGGIASKAVGFVLKAIKKG